MIDCIDKKWLNTPIQFNNILYWRVWLTSHWLCEKKRIDDSRMRHGLKKYWAQGKFPFSHSNYVYPKKYAHGFCFAVLCCGYTLTDFPISSRLTSLALWQFNDCPVPTKQPWWIWINTSCEFIMNDCITTTKQSTTKPCAYFLGYTVHCTWA